MSEEEGEGEGGHVRKDEEKPGNKVRQHCPLPIHKQYSIRRQGPINYSDTETGSLVQTRLALTFSIVGGLKDLTAIQSWVICLFADGGYLIWLIMTWCVFCTFVDIFWVLN